MGTRGREGAAGDREGGDVGAATAGKGVPGEKNSVSKGQEEDGAWLWGRTVLSQ